MAMDPKNKQKEMLSSLKGRLREGEVRRRRELATLKELTRAVMQINETNHKLPPVRDLMLANCVQPCKAGTAHEALQLLKDGNARFLARVEDQGPKLHPLDLHLGQRPHAVLVTCSDSRVPPEVVFDQGLGDLFVVRIAGNAVDALARASILYAIQHLQTNLVIVMGHENCGAVHASLLADADLVEEPNDIKELVRHIRGGIKAVSPTTTDDEKVLCGVVCNVHQTVKELKAHPDLALLATNKDILIVGAYYAFNGCVTFFGEGSQTASAKPTTKPTVSEVKLLEAEMAGGVLEAKQAPKAAAPTATKAPPPTPTPTTQVKKASAGEAESKADAKAMSGPGSASKMPAAKSQEPKKPTVAAAASTAPAGASSATTPASKVIAYTTTTTKLATAPAGSSKTALEKANKTVKPKASKAYPKPCSILVCQGESSEAATTALPEKEECPSAKKKQMMSNLKGRLVEGEKRRKGELRTLKELTSAVMKINERNEQLPPLPDLILANTVVSCKVETAMEALKLLKDGNRAFLSQGAAALRSKASAHPLELHFGQRPHAVLVTCSDSRVPPELVFNQGLGDLFVVRNAGNAVDTLARASIIYAVEHLHTPLIVIMGHESCGAVQASLLSESCLAKEPADIRSLVRNIRGGHKTVVPTTCEDEEILCGVVCNIHRTVKELKAHPDIANLVASKGVMIVGAYYSFNGSVTFFGDGVLEEEPRRECPGLLRYLCFNPLESLTDYWGGAKRITAGTTEGDAKDKGVEKKQEEEDDDELFVLATCPTEVGHEMK